MDTVPTRIGCPFLLRSLDVFRQRGKLVVLVEIHDVGLVHSGDRLVGRDLENVEAVDLVELAGLGDGSTGHPGQLLVHPEVVLEGDRGERLVLFLDLRRPLSPRWPGGDPRSSGGPRAPGR